MDLFGRTFVILGKVLNLRSARHEILAANIANADTPGYVGVDLVFEEELRKATSSSGRSGLTKTHPRHFPQVLSLDNLSGRLEPTETPFMGRDRNSVDMEREMVKLAENTLMYETAVQMLIKKFRGLKGAIK
jgi:flagellar basal-body rod protein FlgB